MVLTVTGALLTLKSRNDTPGVQDPVGGLLLTACNKVPQLIISQYYRGGSGGPFYRGESDGPYGPHVRPKILTHTCEIGV